MKPNLHFPKTTLLLILTFQTVFVFAQRVNDGVVAAFLFSEGAGDIIVDHSGNGVPIILANENPSATTWLPNGGLSINSATSINSVNNASKLKTELSNGTGITMEAWVKSDQIDQSGPARIFTYSFGSSNRNFMLGQNGNRYVARLRTTGADNNGMPNFQTASASVNGQLQHLLYTWDASNGQEKLYLNGVVVNSATRTGTVANWNQDYKVCIGNEVDADRPWLGDIHLAAVYSRALSAQEVAQNYNAGANSNGSVSDETCDESCFVDGFGINRRVLWLPNLPNNMHLDFRFTDEGGHFETFDDGTAHLYGPLVNMQDDAAGFYLDVWLSDRMNWTQWSALGRSWKGTAGIVGNLYQTWDYLIVDPTKESTLIGLGSLEGSLLTLTHKPSDYYYGFQLGVGANDQNLEPGMSCWYFCNGQVNGQNFSGQCDTNLEGNCIEMPVLDCAVDVTVNCEEGTDPLVTGSPILGCSDDFELTYTDEITSTDCPYTILRTWVATNSNGDEIVCEQSIFVADNDAPQISVVSILLENCDLSSDAFIFAVTDNCDENPILEITIVDSTWTSTEPCAPGMYRTQTPGGWGASPNGNNPGTYLHAHFSEVFPNGLTIGCNNTLTLTNAQAVTDFLPSGGTPAVLPAGSLVNPGQNYSNTMASHLVALTLSAAFDANDPNFGTSDFGIELLEILQGDFTGSNVAEILQMANETIGGCANEYSASILTDALSGINENFVDGTQNNGFLDCQMGFDCFLLLTAEITATDACGNSSTGLATIWITDNEAPVFADVPVQITVSCDDIPEPEITVIDECFSELVELSLEQSEYSGGCNTSFQYVWTATDQCGNQSTFTQFVSVIDEVDPVLTSIPQNITISCSDELPSNLPEASDNCDADLLITYDDEILGEGCEYLILRTFSITDNCGNTVNAQQSIAVVDNQAPVISGLDEFIQLGCTEGLVFQEAIVSDNCDATPNVSYNEEININICGETYTRIWTATDACGNQSVFVQVVEITDNAAPVFIDELIDYSIACDELPELVLPAIQDICSEASLSYTETVQSIEGSCAQIVRTFTATDACGNTSIMVQTITLIDDEAPVLLNVPANASIACNEISDPSLVTAIDNCDLDVQVLYNEEVGGAGCSLIMVRTWTATDNCGNASVATQTLNLSDTSAPLFVNAPQNVTLSCNDEIPLVDVVVSDDCMMNVNISFAENTENTACEMIITRTWTATDACGNQSSHTQIISIIDNQAPVFTSVPPSYELACGSNPFLEDAIALDACSDVVLTLGEIVTSDDCGTTITRTWTALDACGNAAEALQTIYIGDVSAPIILGVPAGSTVNCNDQLPAIPNPFVEDDCSAATLAYAENILPGDCASEYTLVRVWTATDACGNTSMAVQEISVVDISPPVFNQNPQTIYPECGNIPAPIMLTASDNCGSVSVSFNESSIGGGCPHLVRTWIAIDDCGNTAFVSQHIYVQDTEPPLIVGVPESTNATCNSIPEMPEPEVSDNCDAQVAVNMNESIVGTGCEYIIVRTWIASDDCGNTSIVSQSIHVTDEAPPVFAYAPEDISVECADLNYIPYPPAFDDCSATINVSHNDQILGEGCEYDILRTYTAVDVCGNSATATQLIHVIDQSAPQFIGVPSNLYVDCANVPAPANVQVIDACSEVLNIEFNEQQFGAGCSYYLQRTWTAEDACGNAASITHLVYVNDNYAPVISELPNITIQCGQNWPAPQQPTVSDNCSVNVNLNYVQFIEDQGCIEILTRIWTATDACGNTQTRIQQVNRIDNVAPVMQGVPANTQATCDQIPAAAIVTATDNCNNAVVWMEEIIIPGNCPYSIVRTWYATDGCGNTSSASQTILVNDQEMPVMTNLPADVTVNCDNIPAPQFPNATDNCFTGISVMMEEEWTNTEDCTYQIIRTFTAADLCGNVAAHVQTITVSDNEAPQLAQIAEELFVECSDLPNFELIFVSDNCDAQPEMEMQEVVLDGDCPNEQTILRIWTASDQCGNTSTVSQVIHIVDHSLPELIGVPEDITVSCNEIPELPIVTAWDDCQGELPVTFSETIEMIGAQDNVCNLGTSISPAGDVAIWLPNLYGFSTMYVFGEEGGYLTENPANGTAHIGGMVYNPDNANQGFIIDIHLESRMNWDAWSALGRSYKDDMGFGEAFHQDWIYYEIVNFESKLVGFGEFEGSVLELTHAPSNYYYGIQIGWGANNRNDAFGLSGWFDYSGQLNGAFVTGMGDVMTENNCCPEQNIIRTWTVTDCAGNTTTHTQVITVSNSFPAPFLLYPDTSEEGEFDVWVNPAGFYQLTFRLPDSMQIQIGIYDINGNLLEIIFSGNAEGETDYVLIVPKGRLASGTYVFKLEGAGLRLAELVLIMP